MLALQYAHRLPADYDMALIRERVRQRGPLWDATPGLAFKAFAARFRGSHGAAGNVYASFYLWRDSGAAADLVASDRFKAVIDGFGRPPVETWLPLDARAGATGAALALYRDDIPLDEGADLQALREVETRLNRAAATQSDIVVAVSALDVANWRLVRLTLSSGPVDAARPGLAYEILHLARPGLAGLGR
jgi:hypothetical protein